MELDCRSSLSLPSILIKKKKVQIEILVWPVPYIESNPSCTWSVCLMLRRNQRSCYRKVFPMSRPLQSLFTTFLLRPTPRSSSVVPCTLNPTLSPVLSLRPIYLFFLFRPPTLRLSSHPRSIFWLSFAPSYHHPPNHLTSDRLSADPSTRDAPSSPTPPSAHAPWHSLATACPACPAIRHRCHPCRRAAAGSCTSTRAS